MEPSLSVIMPVYNQEKFLEETIESVLSQSFKDFEFLILDDGSTDNSAQIIRKYAAKDNRIIPVFRENEGKCNSTNFLVFLAKGVWCAFLDADDVMISERLNKQLNFHLANPNLDASSCHCYYINEKGKFLGYQRYPFLKTVDECRKVLSEKKVIQCAFTGLMTSRYSFIETGGLRSQFWPCEDVEFFNRLIEKGFLMVIIQEELMKYRIHSASITSSKRWNSFIVMHGYAEHCIKLRRFGNPEISLENYLLIRKKDSFWKKLSILRDYYSKLCHKNAGYAFYSKNYFLFCLNLSTAFFLNPLFVIATIQNKVKIT